MTEQDQQTLDDMMTRIEAQSREGERQKDQAIDRVEASSADWCDQVSRVVLTLAKYESEFTTDDVWASMDDLLGQPKDPRAMGAVMRAAASAGWIRATDRTVKSTRAKCHCRPVRVWESLL